MEVDLLALYGVVLAGRVAHHFGAHMQHLFQHRGLVPGIPQTFGRIRLAQVGQQLADIAQGRDLFLAHAQGDAALGAEQVHQYRRAVALGVLEQQGGAARAQGAVGDLGHLQRRIDCGADANQFAALFQGGYEIPKVCVFHVIPVSCLRCRQGQYTLGRAHAIARPGGGGAGAICVSWT